MVVSDVDVMDSRLSLRCWVFVYGVHRRSLYRVSVLIASLLRLADNDISIRGGLDGENEGIFIMVEISSEDKVCVGAIPVRF